MSSESRLATSGAASLALREWPAPGAARAVVLIVHGLGEHVGRYAHVAARLNAWGFAVRGYDHLGHGLSSGVRGGLPHSLALIEDLAQVVDDTRARFPRLPLVLLGHSLGGLVAASFVARKLRAVDALVLSSPGLDPGLSAFQKGLLAVLSRIAPTLRVGNGLDAKYLSHDASVVAEYRKDPLNHDRIGARLAGFLAHEGAVVQAAAPGWSVPTLLMFAGEDRLVKPQASRDFARAAPKSMVRTIAFEQHYHELFNESDDEPVFAALRAWLDERFAAPATAASPS